MNAYAHFSTQMTALYEHLEGALHSVSLTAHWMEMDPTDRNISEYESALAYAQTIRNRIGCLHEAEMRQRSIDAGI